MEQIYEIEEHTTASGGSWSILSAGSVVGELLYRRSSKGDLDVYRTWTDPQLRGQGMARRLLDRAVEKAREEKVGIIPTCSYVDVTMANDPNLRALMK